MSKTVKYSDEQVIAQIRELASDIGRCPYVKDYKDSGLRPTYEALKKRWGSWEKILAAAGLQPAGKRLQKKQYTDTDLIEQVYDLAKRLDRTPTMAEFDADPDTVARLTIVKRFGSWRNFVIMAGLVPNERGKKG